jgi:sugar lactone lactonase YvrE
MKRASSSLVAFAASAAFAVPQAVLASPATHAFHNFGPSLVADCPNPEGIALDPAGNLYAASFPAFQPVRTPSANICVVSPAGVIVDKILVKPGTAPVTNLLGELFEPREGPDDSRQGGRDERHRARGNLYVVDFADGTPPNGRLLRIDPATHEVTTLATGFAAANAIAQDQDRNLFVSDSFLGTITKVAPDGSRSQVWKQDVLLTTHGFPPFGANGVAFDRDQEFLYVANTGDSRILRIRVLEDGSAGPVEIFADGATIDAQQHTTQALHGADGIMFDVRGNLYVCANQANEVQVLSPRGKLVARYDGAGADALDFPASLVFKGRKLYITNLSLFDGGVNSKLSVMLAPFPGLPLSPGAEQE